MNCLKGPVNDNLDHTSEEEQQKDQQRIGCIESFKSPSLIILTFIEVFEGLHTFNVIFSESKIQIKQLEELDDKKTVRRSQTDTVQQATKKYFLQRLFSFSYKDIFSQFAIRKSISILPILKAAQATSL